MIPKIIHQIAPKNKSRWHPIWKECHPTWKIHFSVAEFEHKLWNDEEEIDNLVKEHYPKHWGMYCEFPMHIMKIDFARLCILHKYGGIYADMDVFCYKNFYNELKDQFNIVAAPYGEQWMNGELQVENCLMCCPKENDFVKKAIDECEENFNIFVRSRFNDHKKTERVKQYMVGLASGPAYISKKMIEHKLFDNTLPGATFNNHGLSYNSEFRTKHMLTGIWGKEDIDSAAGAEELLENSFKRYSRISKNVDKQIDFYKDYTEGNYIPV